MFQDTARFTGVGSPTPAILSNKIEAGTFKGSPANTGKDNNNNTAVTTTAHPNNANLCNLIPGLLILSIVVIKLTAPNKLLIPDKCKAKIAKSTLGPL